MKAFRQLVLTASVMTVFSFSFGQTVKTLKPVIGDKNNYSKKEQQLWQEALDKYAKMGAGELSYEKLAPADKALIDSMEMGYGPATDGPGCSWYCGGLMYKVTADESLKDQGNISYKADNIHDFDLFTAWVPDTANGVIGKKVNFHFKPLSPRVNKINIYNGYIKNYDLFKANARVKTFRLYINNVPYVILQLSDTTACQAFKIEPVRSTIKNRDLVLTFEILEIYKGDKYTEVAVSEINFDGLDVH
jgi:hypothetical protein